MKHIFTKNGRDSEEVYFNSFKNSVKNSAVLKAVKATLTKESSKTYVVIYENSGSRFGPISPEVEPQHNAILQPEGTPVNVRDISVVDIDELPEGTVIGDGGVDLLTEEFNEKLSADTVEVPKPGNVVEETTKTKTKPAKKAKTK